MRPRAVLNLENCEFVQKLVVTSTGTQKMKRTNKGKEGDQHQKLVLLHAAIALC
jgi:hypothetical protein